MNTFSVVGIDTAWSVFQFCVWMEWIGPYISIHFLSIKTHYWFAAADISAANGIPAHYADAILIVLNAAPLSRQSSAAIWPVARSMTWI